MCREKFRAVTDEVASHDELFVGQPRVEAAYNNVGVSSVRLTVFVAYKVNSVG